MENMKKLLMYIVLVYGVLAVLVCQLLIGFYILSSAGCYCDNTCTNQYYKECFGIENYTHGYTKTVNEESSHETYGKNLKELYDEKDGV